MDLVVRVSVVHSVWFEAGGLTSPSYLPALMEPHPADQPPGTQIEVAYRGALDISNPDPKENATTLDPYGNYPSGITFLNDAAWHGNISEIDGAPWYQMRLTFISNPETNQTAELSGLGLAYWQ
jgi:hypothetical protein